MTGNILDPNMNATSVVLLSGQDLPVEYLILLTF